MAAVKPVLTFSHCPLDSLAKESTVCKVVDVTVPGVWVAVTEAFYDVLPTKCCTRTSHPTGHLH